jgi:hypothetical protein
VPAGSFLGALTLRVEVPDPPGVRVTDDELRDSLGPVGEDVADRLTVPLKPLMLVRVMSDVVVEPVVRLSELGLEAMEKSVTATAIDAV